MPPALRVHGELQFEANVGLQDNFRRESERIPQNISPAFGIAAVPRRSGLLFRSAVSFPMWERIGLHLLSLANSSTWWIADWLVYGETAYRERYKEALKRTSLTYKTLRNYVWVARQFDISRRRDNLSFGHHAEVAALDQPEQDFWLRKAEDLEWSRNYLRHQVRASLRERRAGSAFLAHSAAGTPLEITTTGPDGIAVLTLRLPRERYDTFMMAASSQQRELEEWAIDALDAASHRDTGAD